MKIDANSSRLPRIDRRTALWLGAVLVAALGAAPAEAATVNVSQRWCGGGCSEGHNSTECVCTYDATKDPRTREAWVSCKEVRCCDIFATYCYLGYVNTDCWNQPATCAVMTEDGGFAACQVECGYDSCSMLSGGPHYEVVNEQGSQYCTRSNETCDWWAPWTCFKDCTLEAQSPWDDHGEGLICG